MGKWGPVRRRQGGRSSIIKPCRLRRNRRALRRSVCHGPRLALSARAISRPSGSCPLFPRCRHEGRSTADRHSGDRPSIEIVGQTGPIFRCCAETRQLQSADLFLELVGNSSVPLQNDERADSPASSSVATCSTATPSAIRPSRAPSAKAWCLVFAGRRCPGTKRFRSVLKGWRKKVSMFATA